MSTPVHPISLLTVAYTEALTLNYRHHPEQYSWPQSQLPVVAKRMIQQIIKGKGGYSISDALKTAMQNLGLERVNYATINQFLQSEITSDDLTEKGHYYYSIILQDDDTTQIDPKFTHRAPLVQRKLSTPRRRNRSCSPNIYKR